MQEKELELRGGSLYYEKYPNKIVITGSHGLFTEVQIPREIEGLPVAAIGKKAFLSRKLLRKIWLPDTIEEVGDWAFAYCDGLEWVELPCRRINFGKAVFLDCRQLSSLWIEGKETVGELLAAAVISMGAYYLLDVPEAGNAEWLAKWDARMLELLGRPDSDGFSKQVLCGEEDYGSTDLNLFLREKRKGKVRLLLLRCIHSQGLSMELRNRAEEYLREHTKGCSSEETWQVIVEEHGTDRVYYELFAALGCITETNLEGILNDIGETYPEMKAYFLCYKESAIGYTDFFADLEL